MKKALAKAGLCCFIFTGFQIARAVDSSVQTEKTEPATYTLTLKKPLNLSGYTHIRFQSRQDKTDSLDVRRARLTLKGKLSDPLGYKLQAEFGGSDSKLIDAELTYTCCDAIKLHAGQFKIPFSLENLTSNTKMATINRSQVVESLTSRGGDVLGNHCGRDIGVMLSGRFKMFDYSLGLFNGSGINTSDLNEDKDMVGRLCLRPVEPFTLGGSLYSGRYSPDSTNPDDTSDRQRLGLECTWTRDLLSLSAEYIRGRDGAIDKAGWYVQGLYHLIPDKLLGVLKYDVFDPDLDTGNNKRSVVTTGLTYILEEKCHLQVNLELKDEEIEINNNALLVQLQYAF